MRIYDNLYGLEDQGDIKRFSPKIPKNVRDLNFKNYCYFFLIRSASQIVTTYIGNITKLTQMSGKRVSALQRED